MNAAAGLVEVRVPDMGNFKDVAIIDVLVKRGEKIEVEAPLLTLETEKATMDVPSTVAGVVEKIHVSKGGTISPGDLIVTVRAEGVPVGAAAGTSQGGDGDGRSSASSVSGAGGGEGAAAASSQGGIGGTGGASAPPGNAGAGNSKGMRGQSTPAVRSAGPA